MLAAALTVAAGRDTPAPAPLHIIGGSTASVETVLKPAGLDASRGLVTTQFLKQPGDPAWSDDDEVKAYKTFLKKYAPSVNPDDYSVQRARGRPEGLRRRVDPGEPDSEGHIPARRANADDAAGYHHQHHTRRLHGVQDAAHRRFRWNQLEPVRRADDGGLGEDEPVGHVSCAPTASFACALRHC